MSDKKKDEKVFPDSGLSIASRIGKAKKDFVIHQNEIHIEIKAGDEISEKLVPKRFWENLKTEGVL